MVHYIRFLKTPRVTHAKAPTVSALITITTDLGESFLSADAELEAILEDGTSGQTIASTRVEWHIGCRDISVTIRLDSLRKNQVALMSICSVQHKISSTVIIESILSVTSEPFSLTPGSVAAPFVRRTFQFPAAAKAVRIFEETGNSIALHIWDAAVGILSSLHEGPGTRCKSQDKQLCCWLRSLSRPAVVLELGAGCGIVGITLASIFDSLEVMLTDLPQAMEVMNRNIQASSMASNSTLKSLVLNWDDELPGELPRNVDLVVVSDCTYNADALPSLVKVLTRLSVNSPDVTILVAMKRRHESEDVFFSLMENSFLLARSQKVSLPHVHSNYDLEEPAVEAYYYNAK